ncbi:MAG: choice-of-anchor Q domain-containing protein, partial [Planctomycetota bacterium]
FTGNTANAGGATYHTASNVEVTDCDFFNNQSNTTGGALVNSTDTVAVVSGCMFSGNVSAITGGGIGNGYCDPTIIDCLFIGNTSLAGGGLYNFTSSATISRCRFLFNTTTTGVGGGLVNSSESDATIDNCLFVGNTSGNKGGAVATAFDSFPHLVNCTIFGNAATQPGGGIATTDLGAPHSETTVDNCIVWGNTNDQIANEAGAVTHVTYSIVQDGYAGLTNISVDPLLVDPDGPDDNPNTWEDNDYRLGTGSPAVDAADNLAVPAGTLTDLDGNPRFVDDPCFVDTGNGTAPITDIGAYERQDPSCDLNGDGMVGISDFLTLLAAWGPCLDCDNCPGDFDDDCIVGVTDFLMMLTNWG